ncbi:xanthine dehydrogenase family protein molybdopterin-binding subunit [Desulfopila aestuarii]|uniref:Xanthine dehydrogenase, molybdenum binding subunit apoprotein n=1 Tax=Desulfopila aestuarii DSM 18488 TaxID=1121416 RepID=A0A1M7Y8X0_9BACT|nr:molybdopterin cofactor-binding domain-containing protein [Desulfopila aestuarii]SHO49084.1 xanthine dehydrogenase, molybdenum binding subunit apoprotein [Desulfopila aestuarii DSM 18488]
MDFVGKEIPKIDGLGLVKGTPAYTSDLDIGENALIVKILRSPHASARIRTIDTSEAEAIPGVECVLTHLNTPTTRFTLAGQSFPEPSPYDRRIVDNHMRYVGDEVAIVAAVDERTALAALKKIKVDYELLTPVLNLEEALDNPVRVHPQQPFTNFPIGNDAARNIAASHYTEQGDVEGELAASEVVMEQTYTTQAQAHAMMETYRATTSFDVNGRLQVMSSTQIPYHVRRHLSRVLGIPRSKIKVLKPRVGGGFGGKQTASVEIFPAIVTMKTGKPARLVYTRQETFTCTTSRHAMQLTVRLGADRDGTIRAIDIYCLSDTGAYGEHAPTVFWVVGQKTLPLYGKAKACRYHGHALYTNKPPGGALRGYGATQGTFALESAINELAAKLDMDPTELRAKNLLGEGETHPELCGSTPGNPATLGSSSLHRCIEKGKALIGWDEKFPKVIVNDTKVRGYGMAVTMQGSGIAKIDTASVLIKLNEDGFFTLSHSASDMGQGSDTILAQIGAEVLEIDMDQIVVASFDLDTLPYDPGAYASSGAYVTGNAARLAAEDMKAQMRCAVASLQGVSPDAVTYGDGVFTIGSEKTMTLSELAQTLCSFNGKDMLIAKGTFGGETSPPPFIAGFAEVEVDLETGEAQVTDYVAVADCGTVLNKNLALIQVEGGVAMGIGLGLYEEVRYSGKGRLSTNSFMEYKIPSRLDIHSIRVAFEESYEPTGPYGAKSIGEVVCNTPAPAISAAVANATGVQVRSLPITAEKVLLGMIKNNVDPR